jgi:hypothetical protein
LAKFFRLNNLRLGSPHPRQQGAWIEAKKEHRNNDDYKPDAANSSTGTSAPGATAPPPPEDFLEAAKAA